MGNNGLLQSTAPSKSAMLQPAFWGCLVLFFSSCFLSMNLLSFLLQSVSFASVVSFWVLAFSTVFSFCFCCDHTASSLNVSFFQEFELAIVSPHAIALYFQYLMQCFLLQNYNYSTHFLLFLNVFNDLCLPPLLDVWTAKKYTDIIKVSALLSILSGYVFLLYSSPLTEAYQGHSFFMKSCVVMGYLLLRFLSTYFNSTGLKHSVKARRNFQGHFIATIVSIPYMLYSYGTKWHEVGSVFYLSTLICLVIVATLTYLLPQHLVNTHYQLSSIMEDHTAAVWQGSFLLSFMGNYIWASIIDIANIQYHTDGLYFVLCFLLVFIGNVLYQFASKRDHYCSSDHHINFQNRFDSSRNASWKVKIGHVLSHLWEDKDSRNILIFLSVNVTFMFVELIVGIMTNSLGLISDAGHMFFDNGALLIGLTASYISKWKADEFYTYGYGRFEILSGFVNSMLLVFIGFSVMIEAIERFYEPPHVSTDNLLLTSVLGLVVNLIGLFFFHDHAHGGGDHGHSHGGSHGHSHGGGNGNMYGVYLHVLADTLGSVGVIASSLLIQYKQWFISDPICSLVISILILGSTLPLLKETAKELVQRVPTDMDSTLNIAIGKISSLSGVIEIQNYHVWKQSNAVNVATLSVLVDDSVVEQLILQQIIEMVSHDLSVSHLTVQINKNRTIQSSANSSNHADHHNTPFFSSIGNNVHNHSHGHGHSHGHNHGHNHGHSHGHNDESKTTADNTNNCQNEINGSKFKFPTLATGTDRHIYSRR